MLAQYTADALIAETRILSHPAANQSIPAAADLSSPVLTLIIGIAVSRRK